MEDGAIDIRSGGQIVGRRISKRAQRNKGLVITFDESARQEYVTGFRKRKNKRRKIAEEQKLQKDRQKRLRDRRQRRMDRKEALGLPADGETPADEENENEDEDELLKACVTYEDESTRTVVNTCAIVAEEDNAVDRTIVVVPINAKKKKKKPLQTKLKNRQKR